MVRVSYLQLRIFETQYLFLCLCLARSCGLRGKWSLSPFTGEEAEAEIEGEEQSQSHGTSRQTFWFLQGL